MMYFPKYLRTGYCYKPWCDGPIVDIIDLLRNRPDLQYITENWWMICTTQNDKDLYDYFTKCKDLFAWINKNLLYTIGVDDHVTTGVKLRIATGMLNNKVKKKEISKEYAEVIHNEMCKTMYFTRNYILDESLPFQECSCLA